MRKVRLVMVMLCFTACILITLPTFACNGGGHGGGNDSKDSKGSKGGSSGGGIGSPMNGTLLGTFFGVPIYGAPIGNQGPPKDVPELRPMSPEEQEKWDWQNLQEAIERSEAAGWQVTKWQAINNGAWVIEWAGWGSRFALNFIPGVGWTTKAALSGLDGAVNSHQQGGDIEQMLGNAALNASVSALISKWGVNTDNSLSSAQLFRNNAINVGIEEGTNRTLEQLKEKKRRVSVTATAPSTNPRGGFGMTYSH